MRAIVIDDHMAEQLWPNGDALGKRVRAGGFDANANTPWLTVVGIVGRVKQYTLDGDSRIAMYLPQTQSIARAMRRALYFCGPMIESYAHRCVL